jgi:hypothetical protein
MTIMLDRFKATHAFLAALAQQDNFSTILGEQFTACCAMLNNSSSFDVSMATNVIRELTAGPWDPEQKADLINMVSRRVLNQAASMRCRKLQDWTTLPLFLKNEHWEKIQGIVESTPNQLLHDVLTHGCNLGLTPGCSETTYAMLTTLALWKDRSAHASPYSLWQSYKSVKSMSKSILQTAFVRNSLQRPVYVDVLPNHPDALPQALMQNAFGDERPATPPVSMLELKTFCDMASRLHKTHTRSNR